MAIVKYKNQTGATYAYESTAQWDPVLKQSRPIRKYLGKVDPETGEIIKTTGKRGRPRKEPVNPQVSSDDTMDYKALYTDCALSLESAMESIACLEKEKKELQAANRQLMKTLSSICHLAEDCIANHN